MNNMDISFPWNSNNNNKKKVNSWVTEGNLIPRENNNLPNK